MNDVRVISGRIFAGVGDPILFVYWRPVGFVANTSVHIDGCYSVMRRPIEAGSMRMEGPLVDWL